jgi:SAM-dependent methyltransferase
VKQLVKDLAREILVILGVAAVVILALVLVHFPWATDQNRETEIREARAFYEEAYTPVTSTTKEEDADSSEDEHPYVAVGEAATEALGIVPEVERFVAKYGIQDARVLEVGAGSGKLQDIVEDYTGLDIAASAAHYFHKPFVQGSATDLPFADNEFDSAWTVWVLEHVDAPEKGFAELRRVVKPGGLLYLFPAWNCTSWAAQGYAVRPYSDFGLTGKVIKASLLIRDQPLFRISYLFPTRALRQAYWKLTGQPTTLRYNALTPNYDHYWTADSDAAVSIDGHETMLWYLSRGDECLNCPEKFSEQILLGYQPLIIRVNKPAAAVGRNRAEGKAASAFPPE